MPLTSDDEIRELLTNARTIAVFGCSDRPDRPSYGVSAFLQRHGYRMLPVNPQITGERVHGEFVWRDLGQIGVRIDIEPSRRRDFPRVQRVTSGRARRPTAPRRKATAQHDEPAAERLGGERDRGP